MIIDQEGGFMSTKRARVWASVVYPESAPENWKELLRDAKVPAFVSPLHDKDKENNILKKPHHHIMILNTSVKTREQMKEFFSKISGVGAEEVMSTRSYARYLVHIDNPEKAQYRIEDVEEYGGADYASTISMTSDRYTAISEMITYCNEQGIISYADLLMYAKDNREDWFRCLVDNSVAMVNFLKSKHWRDTNGYKR